MTTMFWNYVLNNKVASLIFVIVGLSVVLGTIVWSVTCSILNRRKRHDCVHDDECTRSKGHCANCFDFKRKGE